MSITKEQFVEFQGRTVPKEHFRTFVYGRDGQRLMNSYEEYNAHIASKEWFDTEEEVPPIKQKVKKNDPDSQRVCE